MGGKSSSSQSTFTTNNVDNRIFDFGEGAGAVNLIEGSNNSVTATDHQAVSNAFNFGVESLTEAVRLGSDALNTVEGSTSDALNFADNNNKRTFDAIYDNNTKAFNVVEDTQNRAFNAIDDTTSRAFNLVEDSQNNSLDFGFDVLSESLGFGENALLFASEAAKDSNQLVESTMQQHVNTSQKQVGAITDLAKSLNTGGQTDIAKNMQNAVIAVTVGAVVIFTVSKWGK